MMRGKFNALAFVFVALCLVLPFVAAAQTAQPTVMVMDWKATLANTLQQALPAIYGLALAALVSAIAFALNAFKAFIDGNQALKDTLMGSALKRVSDSLIRITGEAGEDLKAKLADGKLSDAEKADLVKNILKDCQDEVGSLIGWFIPGLEDWVKKQVMTLLAKSDLARRMGPATLPTSGGVQTK